MNSYYFDIQLKNCSFEHKVQQVEEAQKRYVDYFFNNVNQLIKIVDIGCGDGVSTNVFFQNGFKNVTGIDLNLEKIKIAQKIKYFYTKGDMHELPFKKKSFDVVYSTHTLEHALYPDVVISEMFRICKNNGCLFVILPYPDMSNNNNKVHIGKFTLGTNIKDNDKNIIDCFVSKGFKFISQKTDSFREPEIWLSFIK